MASALSLYAFINAKLRARISGLLDEEYFRAMARARSFVEAVGLLAGTRFEPAAEVYNRTGDVKLVELEIVRIGWGALADLERYVPDALEPFVRAVLLELEMETVKQAVRLWFERVIRGRPIDDKVAYFIRDRRMEASRADECINAGGAEEIVAALAGTPYLEAVREPLEGVSRSGSLFEVEVALDRWYYAHLIEAAKGLGRKDSEIALGLLGLEIDVRNVNWIVRTKRYYRSDESLSTFAFLPGGRLLSEEELTAAYASDRPLDPLLAAIGPRYAGLPTSEPDEARGVRRLALLEELLRSVLFHEIHRTLGGYPFTIGTLLAYVLLSRNEVRLLISVLNAKYYDLSPERVEELL